MIKALEDSRKRYVVTYDQCSESNIIDSTSTAGVHDHEEGDTLMILHCHEIAKEDPFTECVVLSPDTDVFLLLIHHYPTLPQKRSIGVVIFYSLQMEFFVFLSPRAEFVAQTLSARYFGSAKVFTFRNIFLRASLNAKHENL